MAWVLGGGSAIACLGASAVVFALGTPKSFLAIYLVGILSGVLGALVASRNPGNTIGWLMCVTGFAASLLHLPAGYGYLALITTRGALPLGPAAVWLGAWTYVAMLVFPPMISLRFPDGRVPRPWRAADWLALLGVAGFGLGIALLPTDRFLTFLALPGARIAELSRFVDNPMAVVPVAAAAGIQLAGLLLIAAGYVGSAAALFVRFRSAGGDERLQLKWLAYSGALVAATFAYGAVAWNLLGQPLYLAFTPLALAAVSLPVAIGFAVLRYRLYDIDLIINRTVVYGSLTAILGAGYSAVVTLLNRLFISASGQTSDAAYVVSAFLVVIAFGPVKDGLQRQVDRRIGRNAGAEMMEELSKTVDNVLSVMDVQRSSRVLVDQAVSAFDARGGALYLSDNSMAEYSRGAIDGVFGVEIDLRYEGRAVGRLVMGERRGGVAYSKRDRDALQRAADTIGEAIARVGHRQPVA